ncbi:hypothetical protein CWI75_14340 [Kineobactrum sediminis]|uniref:Glycosyltransferase 2-like domain-containing protein n=1 Tax=Kineobactrum sediminis TaxID=1905677 RepID=A0A2N5XZS1_9GAMM|nr:glycosyltransferase [Kineobactrum sediminis]PLW81645.1 hypothetical protein CWI75_14340 [Kineobactrum sediminis]
MTASINSGDAPDKCDTFLRYLEAEKLRHEDVFRDFLLADTDPLLSVVVPVCNTPLAWLRECIASVVQQSYPRWELCLIDDGSSPDSGVGELLMQMSAADPRVRVRFLPENHGIAGATNVGLSDAAGDFVALLDHDDRLARHALLYICLAVRSNPEAGLIYTNSDRITATGARADPYFKPAWNHALLLSHNYLNHLSVYSANLVARLGGMAPECDGSQDYDYVLRAVESLGRSEILHIPELLYHWRVVEGSVSLGNLGLAVKRGRAVLRDHLLRLGSSARPEPHPDQVIYNTLAFDKPGGELSCLVYGSDEADIRLTCKSVVEDTPDGLRLRLETLHERPASLSGAICCWISSRPAGPVLLVMAGITVASPGAVLAMVSRLKGTHAVAVGPALQLAGGVIAPAVEVGTDSDYESSISAFVLSFDLEVCALSTACILLDTRHGSPSPMCFDSGYLTTSTQFLAGVQPSATSPPVLLWTPRAHCMSTSSRVDLGVLSQPGDVQTWRDDAGDISGNVRGRSS